MATQDFNVAVYTLNNHIKTLENGMNITNQMITSATTPEQLIQAKTYLEMVVKKVEYDLGQMNIIEKGPTKTK